MLQHAGDGPFLLDALGDFLLELLIELIAFGAGFLFGGFGGGEFVLRVLELLGFGFGGGEFCLVCVAFLFQAGFF